MTQDDKKTRFFDKKLSRRDFLKQASLAGAGALVGSSVVGGLLTKQVQSVKNELVGQDSFAFYGRHQAGIVSPVQKNIYLVVLDLATKDRNQLRQVFKDWTVYAENLIDGKAVEDEPDNIHLPPKDTGETVGLNPYRLTLTFGISRRFLEKLGWTHKIPSVFKEFPPFPGEQLEERYTGGDIMIQACADDEQVAFHAVRNLIRKARGSVTMKWSQSGFTAIGNGKETPRNLFGFKDGTANPTKPKAQQDIIWYDGKDWLADGTFMAIRKIRMHLETWDRTSLNEQENTFGRHKISGAPLGETDEFATVDIEKTDAQGNPVIPVDSHVHLAKKTGLELYRRSYSYSDGINETTGQFESGLLFISFQKDPDQFVKIQTMMGASDKLNEYITHIGSGLFACFAGVKKGGYLGQDLFE
ncbi:iron uptake transporter deferrochelatase/peroxidase subunit [Streptococcus sp. E17BB]|uniref:iron uptake transporter deferrochelatase/peroxidase subunit n=1 Tax=Streptococcus sp. E17BB TaxID=3278714 RepID=UPI00359E29A1